MYKTKTGDKRMTNKVMTLFAIMVVALLGGCASKYKSSWDCKSPKGVGCSSIFQADLIARKHIILNEGSVVDTRLKNKKYFSCGKDKKCKKKAKIILINDHYSDFKRTRVKEIEID